MKHKIAILSDIHGNVTALKAVIEDSKAEGATEYWLLGDFVLPGPGTSDLLKLLSDLSATVTVRGNWDDCFLESIGGDFDPDNPSDVYITRVSQYLAEHLTESEIDSIRKLPLYQTIEVEGLKFGISHNLPDKNWGGDLWPSAEQENFDKLFIEDDEDDCDAAVYGHVHQQTLRYDSKGRLIINPGSIGEPFFGWEKLRKERRAQYTILEIDARGIVNILFKKVSYDINHELQLAETRKLPYQELYKELLVEGVSHTHDEELLRKINQENSYDKEVRDYFKHN